MTLIDHLREMIESRVDTFLKHIHTGLPHLNLEELRKTILTVKIQQETVLSVPTHSKPANDPNSIVRIQEINGVKRFIWGGFVWSKETHAVTGYLETTAQGVRVLPLTDEKVKQAEFLGYSVRKDLYISDEQAKALMGEVKRPIEDVKITPEVKEPSIEGKETPKSQAISSHPVVAQLPSSLPTDGSQLVPEEIEGVEM